VQGIPSAPTGSAGLQILVEGFTVFGVEFQYWMLIAILIVVAGIASGARIK
jgi:hypothetical protein